MKLYISNSGIINPVRGSLEDAIESFDKAANQSLTCPSSFRYAGLISEMKADLREYSRETTKIKNRTMEIENDYVNFFSEKKRDFQNVEEKEIEKRYGLKGKVEDKKAYNIQENAMKKDFDNMITHSQNSKKKMGTSDVTFTMGKVSISKKI